MDKPDIYSIRSRSKEYYLWCEGHEWRSIKGYPVTLKDFEDVDLFIYYERSGGVGLWVLSEGKTGLRVTEKNRKKDTLLIESHRVLMKIGADASKEGIRESIQQTIQGRGCSPLYEMEPEAKTAILKTTELVKSGLEGLDKRLAYKSISSVIKKDVDGKVEFVITVIFGPKEENSA